MNTVISRTLENNTLARELPETRKATTIHQKTSENTTSIEVRYRRVVSTKTEGTAKLRYSPRESLNDDVSTTF